jgi:peptide/nickel transport system permease protein
VNSRTLAALRAPVGFTAAMVVVALVVLAVIGPFVWGEAARTENVPDLLQGRSSDHPLGTDNLGRDLLARTLVATRLSLLLAVLAVVVAAGVGIPLGALPTVLGPRGGRFVAAVIDFWLAFPALLLALVLGVVLGVGPHAAVAAVGIAGAPSFARLTQTLAASVAKSDYIAAARGLGLSRRRVLLRHVVPNIAEPIILNTTIAVGFALLSMSGLSFLGLGVQSPSYDWGRLLNEALPRIYVAPEAAFGPCAAIVITGVAFNALGETFAAAASRRPTRLRGQVPAPLGTSASPGSGSGPTDPTGAVLRVEGLTVSFPGPSGSTVTPVRGVSFSVRPGEIVGIVGESASGKSLTALSLSGLVAHPGQVRADRLEFLGHDLAAMPHAARQRLLGTSLAMVFQDPGSSLNPALRIGTQLAEGAVVHEGLRRRDALARAVDRLKEVRISSPERRLRQYPQALSGGMRQRVMIAVGLMGRPRLIVADEPTSALDVTVQQEVLRMLRNVGETTGSSCLLISHDVAVVNELCDRVLVMYAGRIVEEIDAAALASGPAHPYTRALVAAVPDMTTSRDQPLRTVVGRPPDVTDVPPGCAFAPRCALATDECRAQVPALAPVAGTGGRAACWHPQRGPVTTAGPATIQDEQGAAHCTVTVDLA